MWYKKNKQHFVSSSVDMVSQDKMPGAGLKQSFFITLSVLILLLFVTPITSAAEPKDTFDHEHFLLTEVLGEYVNNGEVNYKKLKTDQDTLNEYLQELADISPQAYKNWTHKQKLALWINAYNALAIKGILDGKSPSSLFGRARYFIATKYEVGGMTLSLDKLEKQIIIPMGDPRIHFAIVCASNSCPKLLSETYVADSLEDQLNRNTMQFINDATKNQMGNS